MKYIAVLTISCILMVIILMVVLPKGCEEADGHNANTPKAYSKEKFGNCAYPAPWTAGNAHSGPSYVVIVRHGEEGKKHSHFLGPKGVKRAELLAKWTDPSDPHSFVNRFLTEPFAAILAPSPLAGTSDRPSQTSLPSAFENNIPFYNGMGSWQFNSVKSFLHHLPVENKPVLLVWEHTCIPSLVSSLIGRKWRYKWHGDDYSSVVVIDYKNKRVDIDCENVKGEHHWNKSNLKQCALLESTNVAQICGGLKKYGDAFEIAASGCK